MRYNNKSPRRLPGVHAGKDKITRTDHMRTARATQEPIMEIVAATLRAIDGGRVDLAGQLARFAAHEIARHRPGVHNS